MNYNKWVINNWITLSENYRNRHRFIFESNFDEYCQFIFTGIKHGCWLPEEYINGIIK